MSGTAAAELEAGVAPVVDHVFVLGEPEAGTLLGALERAGFAESCRRHHRGVGTANIFLCFDNAFLELLWIADREVMRSNPLGQLLLKRAGVPGAMPFGIGLRTPSLAAPFPVESFEVTPPDGSALGQVRIARSAEDPSQPFIFRAQRSIPPRDWSDGLAGERQAPGGYADITGWEVALPEGVAPGPDLRRLAGLGLVTLAPRGGAASRVVMTVSRADGGPRRRVSLPDGRFWDEA